MTKAERGKKARRDGTSAEGKVERLLFDDWQWDARPEIFDQGYDINVEVPADKQYPASRFLIQVKSSEDILIRKDGSWIATVSAARYEQYQGHRLPVFVVAYDDDSRSYRWCDACDKKYLAPQRLFKRKGGAKRAPQRARRKINLRLPVENQLPVNVDPAFVGAIRRAWERKDDQYHPPAKAAKIRARRLEERDSRLAVAVNVIDGHEVRIVTAREAPVNLAMNMTFDNPKDAEAARDTFKFGVPNTVSIKHFSVSGSPLFDDLMPAGKLSIKSTGRSARMLLGFANRRDVVWLLDEPGTMYSGAAGGEWRLDNSLLPVEFILRFDMTAHKLTFSFSARPEVWRNCEYRSLPYLGPLEKFFDGVVSTGHLAIGLRHQGENQLLVDTALGESITALQEIRTWLRLIADIRNVCVWANKDLKWTESNALDRSEAQIFSAAATLIRGGKIPMKIGEAEFSSAAPRVAIIEETRPTLILTTWIDFEVNGEQVALVPVLGRLEGYEVTREDERGVTRISPANEGRLMVALNPNPYDEPTSEQFVERENRSSPPKTTG
jgi:hypothetical protein